ncbi:MAG: FAD-dependent oxidoreductase [Nitrospiraceae bacterium]|nr:FAD-dependent oxidoreductase [Nitrospiraceae bacterium]
MKRDPVCNMECDESKAIAAECDGITYYFCSEGCRKKFFDERACKRQRISYDLIIVGGGPAGLTAATYASTLKMEALLIAKDLGGQAIDSTKIENYMGFDFITGPELVEKFRMQLVGSRYIDHLMSTVEKIEPSEEGFQVITAELKKYSAKALIVATGMTRRKLGVPGEEEFQRRGVFYGNIQDLSFVQGKDVAVVGGGNSALQIAESLDSVAGNIHLVSNAKLIADPVIIERVRNSRKLRTYEDHVVSAITGKGSVEQIILRKRAEEQTITIPVSGVFIAIGLHPNTATVSHMIELNEKGEIVVQSDCSTSLPGIFAAGDVTDSYGKRIIIACGEGAKAAMAARQYVLSLRKEKEMTAER